MIGGTTIKRGDEIQLDKYGFVLNDKKKLAIGPFEERLQT
jgi:hypothetical protein